MSTFASDGEMCDNAKRLIDVTAALDKNERLFTAVDDGRDLSAMHHEDRWHGLE